VVVLGLSLGLARLHDYRGWDQTFYLAQTSSLAEDGDVDLRDDFLHLQREPSTLLRALTTLRPNGAIENTFPIGTSVLWLPAYGLAMPLRGLTDEPTVRWSQVQLVALHLLSLSLMVWLVWAFDRWLRRMGIARRPAALAALALVLGTPLVIYGLRSYAGSHLATTVAVMLLVMATLKLEGRPTAAAALLLGDRPGSRLPLPLAGLGQGSHPARAAAPDEAPRPHASSVGGTRRRRRDRGAGGERNPVSRLAAGAW
jgi:hypothetical protein